MYVCISGHIFDVFLLAVGPLAFQSFDTKGSFHKVIRARHSKTTVGYIVTRTYAETLLRNFVESSAMLDLGGEYKKYALDVYWNRLLADSMWLTFRGKFAGQVESVLLVVWACV